MKKHFSMATASALAVVAFIPFTAQAEDNSWYVGGSLNFADIDTLNSSSTTQVAGVTRNLGVDTDSDTAYGIKVGKTLFTTGAGHRFSLELSYSDLDTDVDNIIFQGNVFSDSAAGGDVEVETILLRALYEFELGAVDPYIGFGIGSSDLEINAVYGGSAGTAPGTQPPFASEGSSEFAYQFRVGAEWSLSDDWGLFLEYTRTEVDDIEFSRLGGGPGGLAQTRQEADLDIDSINIGLNYRF